MKKSKHRYMNNGGTQTIVIPRQNVEISLLSESLNPKQAYSFQASTLATRTASFALHQPHLVAPLPALTPAIACNTTTGVHRSSKEHCSSPRQSTYRLGKALDPIRSVIQASHSIEHPLPPTSSVRESSPSNKLPADCWLGDEPFATKFPRLAVLEMDRD
ncbi:hypothetical protein LXL04_007428 [Taraxacum kok-saghyz]